MNTTVVTVVEFFGRNKSIYSVLTGQIYFVIG